MTSALTEFLKNRRSAKVASLGEPGPDRSQIETILQIASRVPDHGKYAPWYFIVLTDDARTQAGQLLKTAYLEENPDAAPSKLDLEAERFLRAPLVIGVISRIKFGRHRQWEQILSAGAACFNLCLAANSLGFGANWLSEWYSYSPRFKSLIGLDNRDHVAGFIYIGTETTKNDERERPDLRDIVTYWESGKPLNKGDAYGNGKDIPPPVGFTPI